MDQVQDIYPLAPLQEGMLFHSLEAPRRGMYISQLTCRLTGVEPAIFKQAWERIVARHAALRTAFLWEGLDQPVQVVRPAAAVPWREIDCRDAPLDAEALRQLAEAQRREDFDLARAPLMRIVMVRFADNVWRCVWTMHHLLADGWSLGIILGELMAEYEALRAGVDSRLPPVTPYRKFIAWLGKYDHQAADLFWRQRLSRYTRATSLPVGQRRDVEGHFQRTLTIDSQSTRRINDVAKAHRITPGTMLLASWALILSRMTGDRDVLFGTTTAGRPPTLPGAERIVGMCMNTAPVAATVHPDSDLLQWLQALQREAALTWDHAHSPLTRLHKLSNVSRGQPLIESLVIYQSVGEFDALARGGGGMTVDDIDFFQRSELPLVVIAEPMAAMKLTMIADASRFDEAAVDRISRQLATALTSMADRLAAGSTTVGQVRWLADEDRQGLLELARGQSSGGDTPADTDHSMATWLQWFDQTVARHPDATAACCGQSRITYADLDKRARQVAAALAQRGIGRGSLVGVCAQRSVETVIAILGVLRAGAGYVPLDPSYPTTRLQWMAQDSGVSLILTTGDRASEAAARLHGNNLEIVPVTSVSTPGGDDETESAHASDSAQPRPRPDDIAYVIYTSGSTGRPRGVQVSHRNLAFSTRARFDFYDQPVGGYLMVSSFAFDSSVAGIFWTLAQGGMLVLPEEGDQADPPALAALIQRHDISHTLMAPSLYRHLLGEPQRMLSSLRVAIVAGEACPASLVDLHHRTLTDAALYNEYGPTEATVWCTAHRCDKGPMTSTPIGRPIPGAEVHVLDDHLEPVPPGVRGEIVIGGPGVTMGYFNDPQRTADRFIASPFNEPSTRRLYRTGDIGRLGPDGVIEFLGRQDHQVKIRGHRVELDEVERTLLSHPDVSEAAAFVITEIDDDVDIDDATLASALAGRGMDEAKRMLAEVEALPDETASGQRKDRQPDVGHQVTHRDDAFDLTLDLKRQAFIAPPRAAQRQWLVRRAVDEWAADLRHLDEVAGRFVPGRPLSDATIMTAGDSDWSDPQQVMESWQEPIMHAMAKAVTRRGGDVLEIGFGRGVSASFIEQFGVRSHTIVEASDACVERYFNPWRQRLAGRDIRLIRGRWQDAVENFEQYDGILFHAVPLDEAEALEHMVQGVNFAAPFFPVAAGCLRPGGVFTYLSTEIDSVARRHQRLLFQYFDEIRTRVQPLRLPADTIDQWWADSMVLIEATKDGDDAGQ